MKERVSARGRGGCLVPFVFLLCTLIPVAWSAELQLKAPQKGWQGPRDPIRIQVPADWPVEVLQRLVLELDGVDVTAMLVREGDYAVFHPVEPLAAGDHELRVMEYLPDGNVVERAFWQVRIRQSKAFREVNGSVGADLTAAAKVATSGGWSGLPGSTLSGSLSAQGRVAEGEWRANGKVSLGLHSKGNGSASGRRLELVNYLMRLERDSVGATVGHFSPLQSSLISASASHRGIGLDFGEIDRRRFRAALFVSRADSESGFQHGLGVTDAENRLAGGRFTFFPVTEYPQRLVLEGMVFDGKATNGGEGTYGAIDAVQDGNGFSLSATSRLLDERLQLHAEYARTRWDPDGGRSLAEAAGDDAWLVGMKLDGSLSKSSKKPLVWSLLITHGRVGPYFHSLMNPSQQEDQQATRMTLGAAWGEWKGGVTVQRTENNVDHLANFPTSRLDSLRADLSRSFSKPLAGLLQNFSLEYSQGRGRPVSVPAGYLFELADDRNRKIVAKAGYLLGGGNGRISLGRAWRDDYLPGRTDTVTDSFQVDYNKGFFEDRLNLRPAYKRDVTSSSPGGEGVTTDQFQIPVTVTGLAKGRLAVGITPSVNRNRPESDTDTETRTVSGWVAWTLLQAAQHRPSVTLSLSGMHQELLVDGATNYREWQLYAGIRIGYGTNE